MIQSVSDGVVLLKGKAGERSVEFSIPVNSTQNLTPVDAALPVHRLAAKAQIKQLEDGEKGTLFVCVYFTLSQICFYLWQLSLISTMSQPKPLSLSVPLLLLFVLILMFYSFIRPLNTHIRSSSFTVLLCLTL